MRLSKKAQEKLSIYKLPANIEEVNHKMRAKYPALTEEHHALRAVAAWHEGAHFLLGLACNTSTGRVSFCSALVCVPGKTFHGGSFKRRYKGVAGEGAVNVETLPEYPLDDVIVNMAGPLAESIYVGGGATYIQDTDACTQDMAYSYSKHLSIKDDADLPSFEHVVKVTRNYLETHMSLVMIAAIYFLCFGSASGEVNKVKIDMLINQLVTHKDFSRLHRVVVYGK